MEKEQEAIEYLKKQIDICLENAEICDDNNFDEEATYLREESYMLEMALNILKEKDKEINSKSSAIKALQCALHERTEERDRKDYTITRQKKQIDLMEEFIYAMWCDYPMKITKRLKNNGFEDKECGTCKSKEKNCLDCLEQYFKSEAEKEQRCIIVYLNKVEHLKMNLKCFGYEAIDYDIQNEFDETDVVIDLFKEIEKAYNGEKSIFDNITEKDTILAFFPCVRFEDQIQMAFRGTQYQQKKWADEQKLEHDLKLHKELDLMYETVTKLAIVCIRRKIPLIIENPYSTTHYLTKYWAIPSKIIDKDRRTRGDYFQKPTQYWFINCEPKYNMILEPQIWHETKTIENTSNKTERSLISSDYANRFIREFILEKEE